MIRYFLQRSRLTSMNGLSQEKTWMFWMVNYTYFCHEIMGYLGLTCLMVPLYWAQNEHLCGSKVRNYIESLLVTLQGPASISSHFPFDRLNLAIACVSWSLSIKPSRFYSRCPSIISRFVTWLERFNVCALGSFNPGEWRLFRCTVSLNKQLRWRPFSEVIV